MSTNLQIQKKLFSVDEYHQMAEMGILGEKDRFELIEGEIIKMPGIGFFHASRTNKLAGMLNHLLWQRATISIQNPIRLSDNSEPQPDLVILKFKENFYSDALPTPNDVLWLIEVSDTSFDYDKKIKLPLYAKAGVPEVWLLNLPKNRLEIYRQPFDDTYQEIRLLYKEQSLRLNSFPDINLKVSDLLN